MEDEMEKTNKQFVSALYRLEHNISIIGSDVAALLTFWNRSFETNSKL